MSIFRSILTVIFAVAAFQAAAEEPTIVQPFAGSELISQQAVDFDRLTYLIDIDATLRDRNGITDESSETAAIEGRLVKGLYRWPENKAPLEIQRSFEKALEAGGFTILVNVEIGKFSPQEVILKDVQKINKTGFGIAGQQVTVFPGHYLSARRMKDGEETVFTLTTSSNQPVYMMEEASVAAMQDDTVVISAESVNADIDEAGKAILYGVQFDTGSAVIRPSSAGSLETIATVLKSRDGQFYIVGHTDDTGGYDMNMRLSAERASAIVNALAEQYGIDANRLQAGGVGPLAPLASNANDAGRQLNRRVELVERLEQ